MKKLGFLFLALILALTLTSIAILKYADDEGYEDGVVEDVLVGNDYLVGSGYKEGVVKEILIEKQCSKQQYVIAIRDMAIVFKNNDSEQIFYIGSLVAYYVNDRLLTGAGLVTCEKGKEDLLSVIYNNKKVKISYSYDHGLKYIGEMWLLDKATDEALLEKISFFDELY